MTLANTDLTSVLAQYMYNLINSNMASLGLKIVLYGDQTNIPLNPAVVVTPGVKRRDLAGVSAPGGRTLNTLSVYVDVLSSKVAPQTDASIELDKLADSIEKFLHTDVQMGGLVIHGFVNEWDPGTAYMQNGQFRMVRMAWVGISKTYLGPTQLEQP